MKRDQMKNVVVHLGCYVLFVILVDGFPLKVEFDRLWFLFSYQTSGICYGGDAFSITICGGSLDYLDYYSMF